MLLYAGFGNGHNGKGGRVISVGRSLCCLPIGSVMGRVWEVGAEGLVVWIALFAIAIAVAYYVIGKTRAGPAQREPQASEMLSKFRDLHSQGVLSDEEFRTIKTTLTGEFQEELNDNDEKG